MTAHSWVRDGDAFSSDADSPVEVVPELCELCGVRSSCLQLVSGDGDRYRYQIGLVLAISPQCPETCEGSLALEVMAS